MCIHHTRRFARAVVTACLMTLPMFTTVASATDGGGDVATWKQLETLKDQQKYEAASQVAGELLEAARTAGDADGWTRALIERATLRIALHEPETAVRELLNAEWPGAPRSQLILHLYAAHALQEYLDWYSWEIRQRERVVSDDEVDLKLWTATQIRAAAHRHFAHAWSGREAWGGESLGDLSRWIDQNSYPARIRGTLRDAVSYMWVRLLADESWWRPEHDAERFRLDVPELVDGDPDTASRLDLTSPQVHPLQKLGAVLSDLEAWHRNSDRPEAAFEARRHRLERLFAAFTSDDDREAIRTNLTSHLEQLDRALPWWSMGQATLADMLRSDDAPDALIHARTAASEGLRAHPSSIGGERCRWLVADLEAPQMALETMAVDGLGRRSLRVTHRNIGRLHFRAYRLDPKSLLASAERWQVLPDRNEVERIVRQQEPAATWLVDLPATPDLRDHRTYVTPAIQSTGLYLIAASTREDFSPRASNVTAVTVHLGSVVIVSRRVDDGLEISVRNGRTGEPLAGARVKVLSWQWREGHRMIASGRTDRSGRFFRSRLDASGQRLLVVAQHGEETVLHDGVHLGSDRPQPREREDALIYTDRSVYRPGQPLHYKIVAYHGSTADAHYTTCPEHEVEVSLVDANGDTVATERVLTNTFGSASGTFEIPEGRLLGVWSVRTSMGSRSRIRVEAYKRPTFEVTLLEAETALRLNRPATLTGEARYYFGLPVTDATADWRVERVPVWPRWWWWTPPSAEPQRVASGTSEVNADGQFEIAFTPEADEREAESGVTYRFRISAQVTDPGGETRSAERTIRLGFVTVELTVDTPAGFMPAGEPMELTVHRQSLDGAPLAGLSSWRLLRLEPPRDVVLPADAPPPSVLADTDQDPYATEGDRLRPRWSTEYTPGAWLAQWEAGRKVESGTLIHDATGNATVPVQRLRSGAYRLEVTSEDPFGATRTITHDIVVTGDRTPELPLPAVLMIERGTVEAGGTLRALVGSGLEDQELVLELLEGDRRIERRVLRASTAHPELLEIPVSRERRGGFTVRLSTLADHQLMVLSERITVPWTDRRLEVELSTFRDRLRPGTEETFAVTVRSADGTPVETGVTELLAYMYDRSLDLFATHSPPQPLSIYPTAPSPWQLQTTLGRGPTVWSEQQGPLVTPPRSLDADRLRFLDGVPIGGPGMRRDMVMMRAAGPMPETAPAPMAAAPAEEEAAVLDELVVASDAAKTAEPEQPPAETVRTDFAETAFFEPHLRLDRDGAATITFQVPDSVTEWNVWVHALTRDLRSGSLEKRTRSVRDLMVRPSLPRFFREGDRAELVMVVNNAGESALTGTLAFELIDAETEESVAEAFGVTPDVATASFEVAPGGSDRHVVPVTVPARLGDVAVRVIARAGDLSDGELRPLPVLPGRMHLVRSRFAAVQPDSSRALEFPALTADDDPTRINDRLVVTVEAQLAAATLAALPYLVTYPYECTEQTLNRFLSAGILSEVYGRFPAVSKMAETLSQRETRLQPWEADNPNRAMALEETPWLVLSRGGATDPERLINLLDTQRVERERAAALTRLKEAQTSEGGFPWWSGGPPSEYLTLYMLDGFARALEFGIEVPRPMVQRGWAFLKQLVERNLERWIDADRCPAPVAYLSYVLSCYPDTSWTGGVFTDDDRDALLELAFEHWRELAPRLKCYLALALHRAGRTDDGQLLLDSVMDSAQTDPDLGTYWAPEDRAWLWYNDTVETHAFALRTLTELEPDDPQVDGLVQWLLLNRTLNHWKSTRATAEALYALVPVLAERGAIGARETATVQLGERTTEMVWPADEFLGPQRTVVDGPEVTPEMGTVTVAKGGPGLAFASATWHFSTEELPEAADGDLFAVERTYFKREPDTSGQWSLTPLASGVHLAPGDQVEVHLSVRAKHAAEYVHLRDPRPAGLEPETLRSGYRWDLGLARYEAIHDSATSFFMEWVPAGEYTLKHRLRVVHGGTFRVAPATLQSMYAPEFAAHSAGHVVVIEGEDASSSGDGFAQTLSALRRHLERHPYAEAQDVYKLLHHSVMGPAHAIEDADAARSWLERELETLGPAQDDEPLVERLGGEPEIVRVHLRPFVASGGDPDALNTAFVASASAVPRRPERLGRLLEAAAAWLHESGRAELAEGLQHLAKRQAPGYGAVHHSQRYTDAAVPAYRVLTAEEAATVLKEGS